jgi:hypothetical protein
MAAITELEEIINAANPNILGRNQSWFKTWSQSGKQQDYTPAVKLIKQFEGCHLTAYADPLHGWDVANNRLGHHTLPQTVAKYLKATSLQPQKPTACCSKKSTRSQNASPPPFRTGAGCDLLNNQL